MNDFVQQTSNMKMFDSYFFLFSTIPWIIYSKMAEIIISVTKQYTRTIKQCNITSQCEFWIWA